MEKWGTSIELELKYKQMGESPTVEGDVCAILLNAIIWMMMADFLHRRMLQTAWEQEVTI